VGGQVEGKVSCTSQLSAASVFPSERRAMATTPQELAFNQKKNRLPVNGGGAELKSPAPIKAEGGKKNLADSHPTIRGKQGVAVRKKST